MSLKSFIKNKYETRQLRNIFGKYISKEVANEILDESTSSKYFEIHETTKDFCIIKIIDNNITNSPILIKNIYDFIQNYDSIVIDTCFSSMILLYFGLPSISADYKNERITFSKDLINKFGKSVSIIHGSNKCTHGIIGNSSRMSYTILIPEFNSIILKLLSAEYGQIIEY